MASKNESYNEAEPSSEITVMTPPQSVSPPIDYIDLTQDTPTNRRAVDNRVSARPEPSNATREPRRSARRVQRPVPDEVINIDDSPLAESRSIRIINDSISGEQVTLTCPVCLEELSSRLKPMTTHCGHIFCEGCLRTVSRTTKTCPCCQTRIKVKSFTRLYF